MLPFYQRWIELVIQCLELVSLCPKFDFYWDDGFTSCLVLPTIAPDPGD